MARRAPDLSRHALLHDVVQRAPTLDLFGRLSPEVVFHAAAHKHVPMMEDHPAAAVDNNLFGTRSVADAADAAGTGHFVLISTDKAVNPISIMGATKRLAELYVQDLNGRSATAFAIVRFGNVLGSTGSVLDIWSRQIEEGGPLSVTDPRMTRYFMTIPEAAALVIQSAALLGDEPAAAAAVFLLDMGRPVRVLELARRFAGLHGLEVRLPAAEYGPQAPTQPGGIVTGTPVSDRGTIQIVFTGVRPGEKLHEELATESQLIRPTQHPDIKTWHLPVPDPVAIADMINALAPERRSQSDSVARTVRRLVSGGLESAAA